MDSVGGQGLEKISEIQTERGVPGRDIGNAAIKARRLKAESPPDNIQDIVHHHFMMFDGSKSHWEMKGCDLVFLVEEHSLSLLHLL